MTRRWFAPLRIGDRFSVRQDSKKPNGRYCRDLMKPRRYFVMFRVGDDGLPVFTGGVKPTFITEREVNLIVQQCLCPERLSMDRRNSQ